MNPVQFSGFLRIDQQEVRNNRGYWGKDRPQHRDAYMDELLKCVRQHEAEIETLPKSVEIGISANCNPANLQDFALIGLTDHQGKHQGDTLWKPSLSTEEGRMKRYYRTGEIGRKRAQKRDIDSIAPFIEKVIARARELAKQHQAQDKVRPYAKRDKTIEVLV